MNSLFSATFAALALSLVACSASTPDDATAAGADLTAAAAVAPGTFRLFSDAHHVANPDCESYTDLTLKTGQASLVDGLGGKCALTAFPKPNPRSYTLHASSDGCGTKVYEGSRRVAVPGAAAVDGLASIKITDYRETTCEFVIPAAVVVEETDPGFPGAITRTMFAADEQPSGADRIMISCSEADVDHGASVQFFASVPAGEIVRADYSETTIATTSLVATLDSCLVVSKPAPFEADGATVTECRQHIADGGFAVKLTTGGFTGVPSAELLKVTFVGEEAVKSLRCQYTP